jgi:membrane protease YdiL (CAAX protease family)
LLSLLSAGLKILAYLIGTVALGATFAPWLFWAGQLASHFKYLQFLANTDFQRFFNRSILLSAFLLLVPLLRWVGLDRLQNLGLRKNSHRINHLVGGFLISACTMSALGACLVGLDICQLKSPLPWHLLPPLFLTAISVAVIEEALFRGAILGLFRQTISTVPAAISVSALFSIVHFLSPAREQITEVHWYSGFELLPQAFWKFSDPLTVLGGFTTIGILGLILAHATIRTYSLWLGIGLHSGLVFAKMGFNKVTKKVHDAAPWFGGDITVGLGSVLVLLLLWFLVWIIYLREKSDSEFA